MHAGHELLGVPADQNAALRIPVLSVVATILALLCALVSLGLGFLIFGIESAGVAPNSWVIGFLASSLATFVLLLAAMVSGRRALGLRSWRSAWDARFFWETVLGTTAAVALGSAVAFSYGSIVALLFWGSVFAVYVTLARWTWWTWRSIERFD